MRQVTGRSSNNSTDKASIRLASGGRFFSASMLGEKVQSGDVVFVVDTARVTLIPASVVSELSAEQFLAINGQNIADNEVAIFSEAVDEKVAAMAINREAFETITSALGNKAHFTSPLLETSYSYGQCLAVEVCDTICYLRLYNNGLQVAEALEVESYDELLYYVANILDATSMSNSIPMYIIGSKKAAKLLKKYYKVICE